MEEKSLRITGTDKSFFNKITTTLTKMLIPTQLSLNGMRITVKRNAVVKAFNNMEKSDNVTEDIEKKYESAYAAYLESLDKYVMDSIYKKVSNNTATKFEKNALSEYYNVTRLKEKEYIEYKYRKQKYLLELDNEDIKMSNKEKVMEKYEGFYVSKMDYLYKAILKNYSIKIADTINVHDSTKDWIFAEVFATLEDYIEKIVPIKMKNDEKLKEDLKEEYEKFDSFSIGKLDTRDTIEKNMVLLGISRKLFTHSLPLAVAEQCYKKLLRDARCLVQDTKIATKREKAYSILMTVIETYNSKLLATKVYWERSQEREMFKKFYDKYLKIETLKENNSTEYMKQKEILFIKNDIKSIKGEKTDYSKLLKYYKRKLVDYDAIKEIKAFKAIGHYIKRKEQAQNV